LPFLEVVPWSLVYLASVLVSIIIALDVLSKDPQSMIHRLFFVLGLISAIYLSVVFLVLNAPSPDQAIKLFRFSNQLYFLSIGILAYFVQSLAGKEERGWLILLGSMLAASSAIFIPYDSRLTDFGWVVSARPIVTIEGILAFAYLLSYSWVIAATLYDLMGKARAPWLSRKYAMMLLSFVFFQMLGVLVLNALILIWPGIPHVAGILYLFSLVSIWYGFKFQRPVEVRLSHVRNPLSDSYRRFISRLLEVAPSDELGLKTMDLLEYLDRTRLIDVVTYDRLRVILNGDKIELMDNIQALDKTIEYLEKKEWSVNLADALLGILESVYDSVEYSKEKIEGFQTTLMNHQDFLKSTGVIYGLANGRFLDLIGPDNSLAGLPEWSATLRLYKRLLLPIREFIVGPIGADFFRKLRSMDIVRYLDVSEDGDIRIERVQSNIESLPQEQRTDSLRTGFNALLSWVFKNLMDRDPSYFARYIKVVRRIVMLNSGSKGILKTYVSLVNRISKEIGRAQAVDLILLEGHKVQDLDAFSSELGLTHDGILHERILVEYDPRFPYEVHINRAIDEISANTERCALFTRKGSKISKISAGIENLESRILATPGVHEEGGVPFNDITQLINAVSKSMESELETWVLFDNISDLILSAGFDQAYVFARHVTDVIASKNGSSIFLMNKAAHNPETKAAFEGLFSTIIEMREKPKLVKA